MTSSTFGGGAGGASTGADVTAATVVGEVTRALSGRPKYQATAHNAAAANANPIHRRMGFPPGFVPAASYPSAAAPARLIFQAHSRSRSRETSVPRESEVSRLRL